jgi:hypothetical protein
MDPEPCFLQDKVLLEKLTQFITSLIENGNLGLARALRSQFILKYEERRTRLLPDFDLASMNSINRRCNLLNFKSTDLAEQMTLLGKWVQSNGSLGLKKIRLLLDLPDARSYQFYAFIDPHWELPFQAS